MGSVFAWKCQWTHDAYFYCLSALKAECISYLDAGCQSRLRWECWLSKHQLIDNAEQFPPDTESVCRVQADFCSQGLGLWCKWQCFQDALITLLRHQILISQVWLYEEDSIIGIFHLAKANMVHVMDVWGQTCYALKSWLLSLTLLKIAVSCMLKTDTEYIAHTAILDQPGAVWTQISCIVALDSQQKTLMSSVPWPWRYHPINSAHEEGDIISLFPLIFIGI